MESRTPYTMDVMFIRNPNDVLLSDETLTGRELRAPILQSKACPEGTFSSQVASDAIVGEGLTTHLVSIQLFGQVPHSIACVFTQFPRSLCTNVFILFTSSVTKPPAIERSGDVVAIFLLIIPEGRKVALSK